MGTVTIESENKMTARRQSFLALNFHDIHRRFQQKVDDLIAGTVGVLGDNVQPLDQLIPHADGHDLVPIVPPAGGLLFDFDLLCHTATLSIVIV